MSEASPLWAGRAATLRQEFDRSFAVAQRIDTTPQDDFLAIRLGSEPHVLRLAEITGLFADKHITPVPSRAAGLLGIAGFRGIITPVYDLHMRIGLPPAKSPRWLVVAAAASVAFAFEQFETHLRLPRDAIIPRSGGAATQAHVEEFAGIRDLAVPIIRLQSVIEAIRMQAPLKEEP